MKAFTKTLMAMSLLTSHLAQASGIEDLPGFDEETTQTTAPVVTPAVPTQNTQASNLLAGSVSINAISRKSNGTLYTVDLKQALSLVRIDLRVTAQKLKLHRVTLVTDTGARVNARQLENSAVLEAGNVVSSENLNQSDRISSIEVVAESYGAEASILLTAIADRDVPVLRLRTITTPVQPTRPTPPAPPVPSTPPVHGNVPLRSGMDVLSGPMNDGKYYAGTVVEVYNNSQVLVRDYDDSKTYVRPLSSVSRRVQCDPTGVICQRSQVLSGPYSGKYYTGVVRSIYANGLYFVTDDDDGKNYTRKISEIALRSQCAPSKHCAGDNVLSGPFNDGKYYNGVVVAGYSNGLIAVRDSDDGKVYYRNPAVVLKSVRCDEKSGLCIGNEVLSGPYSNNRYYSGVVTGIYSNGVIYIRDHDDGKSYARKASQVTKRIRCEQKKGLCEGARVVSGPYQGGKYYAGTIVRVYANGIIQVRDDDDGKTYERKAHELTGLRN
ncbi:hypothetical protein AZI87_15230 [Bdellovibrio bacteriovorus]|uniref:Bdellovibrio beta-sandwich domain-containing protein n=1 Tax=Bdellovibrio bacteriovorus TaxID=959 RepID=A0A162FWP2_BDEBC|nr:beta-sandwich domain-containing protein [Bdellovibrio bacteriovorus]KYG62643.1 hypothetical protein AZI87_15230 [Bdellovibrio bacteriovorus]